MLKSLFTETQIVKIPKSVETGRSKISAENTVSLIPRSTTGIANLVVWKPRM